MSEKIALVTDSSCDLPTEFIQKHGIYVLPLRMVYGCREYRDLVDIDPQEVYDRMPDEVPTTSQPSSGEIRDLLHQLREEGITRVLAIHISSGLSGTFETVCSISREFKNMDVKVIDSRTLSMGLGFMVREAAYGIAQGLSLSSIVEKVRSLHQGMRLHYVLDTLEYLRRGGRIGKVASAVGGMLNIKPIISVDEEGKYYAHCKVRGRKKSIDKMLELAEEFIKERRVVAAVMHGGAPEEGEALRKRVASLQKGNIVELIFGQISPVLGVHTGPGLLGICVCETST